MRVRAFFTNKNSSSLAKIILGFTVTFLAAGFYLWGKNTVYNKDSEWKTYQNKKYGYQVKYPAGWEVIEAKPREGNKAVWSVKILVEEEVQKVTFLEKAYDFWPGEFQVRVMSNPDNLSLERWIDEHEPQDVTGGSLIQDISDASLNGKEAKRLSIFGFDHEGIEIVTLHKGYVYSLHFTGSNPNDPEVERHRKIYDQMCSSFTLQNGQRNIQGQALTLNASYFLSLFVSGILSIDLGSELDT